MEGDILENFFFLMYISFGYWYVNISLKVVFTGKIITSAYSLAVTTISLDIDDVSDLNFFFFDILINLGVKF
jgi:hypothetical protein